MNKIMLIIKKIIMTYFFFLLSYYLPEYQIRIKKSLFVQKSSSKLHRVF